MLLHTYFSVKLSHCGEADELLRRHNVQPNYGYTHSLVKWPLLRKLSTWIQGIVELVNKISRKFSQNSKEVDSMSLNAHFAFCPNRILSVKGIISAYNKEKALCEYCKNCWQLHSSSWIQPTTAQWNTLLIIHLAHTTKLRGKVGQLFQFH